MKKTFLMLFLIALITGCSSEDLPDPVKLGTETQKFWAHQGLDYSGNDIYLIYTFDKAGNFDIEERNKSKNGTKIRSYYGKYVHKYPELDLEIFYSADCPDCSNKFTATIIDEKGSFTYTIYDMVSGKNKDLKFVRF